MTLLDTVTRPLPRTLSTDPGGVSVSTSLQTTPQTGPQTNLRDTIAHALRTDGSYLGEIELPSPQRLVDAQWAAHLAGRTVGRRVSVVVREERSPGSPARAILHVTPRSH